jgi:hypothetical protein
MEEKEYCYNPGMARKIIRDAPQYNTHYFGSILIRDRSMLITV